MHIGIVGGGITGLVAAMRLTQAGHKVTIIEKGKQLGGMAACFEVVPGGDPLEVFYHHLFGGDKEIISLINELGLNDHLEWLTSRMGVFVQEKLFDFGTATSLLKFTPMSFLDRIRWGLVTLYLTKVRQWKHFEAVTAAEWMTKRIGEEAFTVFWKPLLRSKFSDDWDNVSMVWLWCKLYLRAQSRKHVLEREKLGYIRGSFQVLVDALEQKLRESDTEVFLSTAVQKIARDVKKNKNIITLEQGKVLEFDAIIATMSSSLFNDLTPGLPEPYAQQLTSIKSKAVLCLVLVLDQSLSPYYWLNITDEKYPFVAVIEHTNYIPRERYAGKHILYVSRYLDANHELYSFTKEALIEYYLPYIQKINPNFSKAWVEQSYLFEHQQAQPVIGLHYADKVPAMQTPLEGVYLANIEQIYPEDRGTNYSVRLGEQVSALILKNA